MRCAERYPDGVTCRRDAVAAVTGGAVVVVLCGDCTVRAVRHVADVRVRWLTARTGSRRPA